MRAFLTLSAAALLMACSGADTASTDDAAQGEAAPVAAAESHSSGSEYAAAGEGMSSGTDYAASSVNPALKQAVAAQSDEAKARYAFRNPAETLAFFGIEPGMAIGEALPGGGWYSKILLPYLGEDGRLVGVNYPDDLWSNFSWMTEENLARRTAFPTEWPEQAAEWNTAGAQIDAYTFDTLPADGSLDAFLFIRALHNLNRFEDARFLREALASVNGALKPGGIVGVVQHEGPADADDAWADGANGYLKKADVIAAFEAAGFELVGESDINANPKDVPTSEDAVWRLKPSRNSPKEDTALRETLDAIGESNRMTLRFRKA